MKKLVTISREYGSGGRIIGRLVAEKLGIPFYDKEILDMAAEQSGLSREIVEAAELRAKSSFSYSLASAMNFGEGMIGDTVSINEKLFVAQYDVIHQIAEAGEGVIVGRCADSILKDRDNLIKVFIYTDVERRIDRICEYEKCSRSEAASMIKKADRRRSFYHNYYSDTKWGDRRSYDICIDSSIGIERVAKIIKYIAESK